MKRITAKAEQGLSNRADPMLSPITKKYADHSTAKMFAFSFFCDQCGKEWRSAPQPFNPGELASPTDLRVYRMLWSDRRKAAYERANLEALYVYNRCPACGRRVCMECFYRSETDTGETCKDCRATNLKRSEQKNTQNN